MITQSAGTLSDSFNIFLSTEPKKLLMTEGEQWSEFSFAIQSWNSF